MIKIFQSENYLQFFKWRYSKYGKTSIKTINGINLIEINYPLYWFKELVLPYINTTHFPKELIDLAQKQWYFRIRILSYSRWTKLSDNLALEVWLQKKYTQILNLNQSLDEIFKNFRPTYRNEINKYIKGKIEWLKFTQTNYNQYDLQELEKFYELYKKTISKAIQKWAKNLIIEPFDYFRKLFKVLQENITLYNLYKDNILINSALILKDKNWIYYLKWASNDNKEYRKVWGGRILHYEIIKQNLWNGIYDLGWINWKNLNDPITRFKIWFGWKTLEFWWGNIILNTTKNKLFKTLTNIYNLIRLIWI